VRHCHAVYSGGGILLTGVFAVVTDCLVVSNEITSNASWGGGGVAAWSGAQLLRTWVVTNLVVDGPAGGVECKSGSVVSNCHIVDNRIAGGNIYGGGIRVQNGGTVVDCVISNNYSPIHAGGIYFRSTTGTLANCTIVYNRTGAAGGGVLALTGTQILISNCVIECNRAQYGAGLANSAKTAINGNITVTHSRVVANTNTSAEGAGLFLRDNHGLVAHCVIASNVIPNNQKGAGLYIHNASTADAEMTVRNCLVTGNRAPGTTSRGGGVYIGTGIVAVTACTVADNEAMYGGGIAVSNAMLPGNLEVWNTVVAFNRTTGAGVPDLDLPAAHLTNAFYYSCSPTLTNAAQGNITNAPVFADYAGGIYRLQSGSPCINTGTNQDWMIGAKDLDGIRRIDRFSGTVDMGAYEHLPAGMLFKVW